MPDITMCINHNCPIRETCYRYKATPSNLQSYSVFEWNGECKYYLKIKTK